ncbi:dTDP-4-dehydrorhamnose reductase [Pedobacter nanyangensis]|uniref:dTDP-4-dehydrorhamnose reductase n=1 Tax=Pedobacter nanyangensis TaxID=1562389 RepID=UPI000DE3B0FD|nr:dTDP-4-dehydrorhamnose reductase [Pedobacter nanyangensis]
MGNIVVIGAGGQLGQCIKKIAGLRVIENVVFPDENTANILDVSALNLLFDQTKPSYVVNCAAYTAVDKAEDEADIAKAVNETGAKNLAQLCKKYQATLIHISTDFVFEGKEVKLLKEDDKANPISVYGATKLDGELAIINELDTHVIIRTSWLYSEFANNFVKTMLKLGAERDELNVIADQVGTPTYAVDLANIIFDIIQNPQKKYGIYHFSNEGVTSWYDFAKAIFDLSGTKVNVNPIPTSAYPTKAKRPPFSVMDKTKIKADYSVQVPYWLDSLKVCMEALKSNH